MANISSVNLSLIHIYYNGIYFCGSDFRGTLWRTADPPGICGLYPDFWGGIVGRSPFGTKKSG